MLVQLISVLQVILLCDNSHSYLFYHGTMYFQLPDTGLRDLAACGEHNTPPYGHLSTWTIGQVVLNIIQVSGRSRRVCQTPFNGSWIWTGVPLLGMPLWNMKELMQGLVLSFPSIPKSAWPCRSMEVHCLQPFTFDTVHIFGPSTVPFEANWSSPFLPLTNPHSQGPMMRGSTLR